MLFEVGKLNVLAVVRVESVAITVLALGSASSVFFVCSLATKLGGDAALPPIAMISYEKTADVPHDEIHGV
jgi:hypothetical protein